MATSTSFSTLSKRLSRIILSNTNTTPPSSSYHLHSFFSTETSSQLGESESPTLNSDSDSVLHNNSPSSPPHRNHSSLFEDAVDLGIYKAILVGQVGQTPLQKRLRNGRSVTLTTVGTGGVKNERIPFPNENPREYADRCNVQWHRVVIYPDALGDLVTKHAQPGSILYLEGNLETKIFTDQVTGIVKRVREIAVRSNGRVVFLGNGGDFVQPSTDQLRGVGYF